MELKLTVRRGFLPKQNLRTPQILRFTFIEVLVAVGIAGMSMVLIMAVAGTARSRLQKAENHWAREHLLTQASEFYLLAGYKAKPPAELLPKGFTSACALETIEDLPAEAPTEIQGWRLGRLRIQVWNNSGGLLGERVIEKMVPATDFF